MSFLYIDTSYSLSVGFLDQNLRWVDSLKSDGLASECLHEMVREVLKKSNITLEELDSVIFNKGPGSYTGLRISEGFDQFLRNEGILCHSFYSFEYLKHLNAGTKFVYPALKGEYLLCEENNQKLVKNLNDQKENVFYAPKKTHLKLNREFSDIMWKNLEDVFEENISSFFKEIITEQRRKDIYYFRPLDQEYRR